MAQTLAPGFQHTHRGGYSRNFNGLVRPITAHFKLSSLPNNKPDKQAKNSGEEKIKEKVFVQLESLFNVVDNIHNK